MRLVRNRFASPIAAMNVAAQIRFTPGTVINRRISGQASACWAISRSTSPISQSRNVDLAQPGVDRLALLDRQLQAGQPLAALDAEQIRARRLALQPALQHRVDLVLGARARVHELLAAGEPAAQHPAALIGHPHRLKLPLPQQARQRPRVELSVFARALQIPVSSGLTTTTRSTYGSRIRATSHRCPSPPTPPDRSAARLSASAVSPSGVLGTRPAGADLPVLADRDHTEITVHIQTDRPTDPPHQRHVSPPHVVDTRRENQRDKRHRPIRAQPLNPGKSQGRPNE